MEMGRLNRPKLPSFCLDVRLLQLWPCRPSRRQKRYEQPDDKPRIIPISKLLLPLSRGVFAGAPGGSVPALRARRREATSVLITKVSIPQMLVHALNPNVPDRPNGTDAWQ